MGDIQHSALDYTENHVAHAYEYANTAQREGASGFVAGDIGKLALQTDDKSLWMLSTTAPVWVAAILTGTITVDTIAEDTPGAGVTIDGVLCKDSAVTASNGFTGALTGAVTGDVTGDLTGDLIGDVLAADTTLVLDAGTDGSDATFTGDVTGDVTGDITGTSGDSDLLLGSTWDDVHGSQTFGASGTFTVPANVHTVFVDIIGGGGGGGGCNFTGAKGGGGSAGSTFRSQIISVTPSDGINVIVGSGGGGGGAGLNGGNGVPSVFGTLSALGGGGGAGVSGSAASGAGGVSRQGLGFSANGGAGGVKGGDTALFVGGAVGGAGVEGGGGGASLYGAGAAGGAFGAAASGQTGAGGGGGAGGSGLGGAGGSGKVIVRW